MASAIADETLKFLSLSKKKLIIVAKDNLGQGEEKVTNLKNIANEVLDSLHKAGFKSVQLDGEILGSIGMFVLIVKDDTEISTADQIKKLFEIVQTHQDIRYAESDGIVNAF